jgi:hypothetical protein
MQSLISPAPAEFPWQNGYRLNGQESDGPNGLKGVACHPTVIIYAKYL